MRAVRVAARQGRRRLGDTARVTVDADAPSNPRRGPGARSYATIRAEDLRALERGDRETATHVEQMALDMGALLAAHFPELQSDRHRFDGLSFLDRMREGGLILIAHFGSLAVDVAHASSSDVIRGWGAFAVGANPAPTLEARIAQSRRFAMDSHFAVREWAWLGVRPHVVEDPKQALRLLQPLAEQPSAFIRRFAVEATRPRSVWGAHCPLLKADPNIAIALLEAVAEDRTRYVEDSLANWLNDAGKTRPDWVIATCRGWQQQWGAEVDRLVRRSMRSQLRAPGRGHATQVV